MRSKLPSYWHMSQGTCWSIDQSTANSISINIVSEGGWKQSGEDIKFTKECR